MKEFAQRIVRALPLCIIGSTLAVVLLVPATADAWLSSYSSTHYYHDNDWSDARYLQEQSIASQEEARREVQREKNREEIEKKKAADEREYLASRAAAREASRAASRAPRGAFYRKPGSTISSLPDTHVKVEVDGQTYFYYRGIFYFQLPGKFIVVPAPVGAVVDALPEGVTGALYKGDAGTYFYYFGTFFMEENGRYKVVAPPAGTTVGYVPDGYSETKVDGTVQYQFGDIRFRPGFFGNEVIYQVAEG